MIALKESGLATAATARQAVAEPSSSRVVPKPVPQSQTQDPRRYQLDQLKKRFSPIEKTLADGTTTLVFKISPSDPDFPFELDFLEVELRVPASYPKGVPTLSVKNQNIPKGFALNVERGWDRLVQESNKSTLLALTHALDRKLEEFLSEKKADTVKVVIFKDTRHLEGRSTGTEAQIPTQSGQSSGVPSPAPQRRYIPPESFTADQIAEARVKRARETKQIETRMSTLPLYFKSKDGIVYTLPLEPRRRSELPAGIRAVNSFQLVVPLLYPLQPLIIVLNDADPSDAEAVEQAFTKRSEEHKELTLINHVNYLSQNLHMLSKKAPPKEVQPREEVVEEAIADREGGSAVTDNNRSHIKIIPRPLEWTVINEAGDSDDSDDDSVYDSEDSDGGGVTIPRAEKGPADTTQNDAERGTAIYFPNLDLHGVDLLRISALNISVKCERCKAINEALSLKPGTQKSDSCKKCTSPFTVLFRQQLVHQNSTRAGFVDVAGCTVSSLLASSFVPTCSTCGAESPPLTAVQGDAVTNTCRECHARFTFKIPEVKFLRVTPAGILPPTIGPRRKVEKLGIHAGEPLPKRGSCAHYKRSYRWFRFSCCNKVYACDKCHDEAENHVNEWANRMICGLCSREQNYSVDTCRFCGSSVIGRKGSGFWEGGRGTRDKMLMNRKDPKKYKRVGGTEGKRPN